MSYVGGGKREPGCIFCNRLAAKDDAHTLIVHRGPRSFVIMNLFPYNTGHVMIVPNEHVASPEEAEAATLAEMATLRAPLLSALRRALSADGFNLGMNIGAVAGAGVADHLHEHVVPRWQGDANFMPILAGTMVIPELIPVTYAKIRAELASALSGSRRATVLLIEHDGQCAVIGEDGSLPAVLAAPDEPIWRAVLSAAGRLGANKPEILGWAGSALAGQDETVLAVGAEIDATHLPSGFRSSGLWEFARGPNASAASAASRLIAEKS
jgi:ATP adenylyltransferase